jgi:ligand-binding SRPBCC domain-containing protein
MRHAFKTNQWVPYPIERVFAFFVNPDNLPRLMPEWQKARIERINLVAPPGEGPSHPSPAAAGIGTTMTISFRAFPLSPIRTHWEASIAEFQWNRHFCDEQPSGPFAYWRHCHQVSAERSGPWPGTNVTDDLIYELPFGKLSEPAHTLFVRRQIEATFAYRQQRLLQLLA